MRYFNFSFLSFLNLLASIFFRPTFKHHQQPRRKRNLHQSAYLRPRGWKGTVTLPALGGLSTLGHTALNARRRRLMSDPRLQMV